VKPPILTFIPAPLNLRLGAAICDLLLIGLVVFFFFSRIYLPSNFPEAGEVFREWQEALMEEQEREVLPEESVARMENLPPELTEVIVAAFKVLFLGFWLYFSLSEYFFRGITLGKRMFSLRTLSRVGGGPALFFACLLRGGVKTALLLAYAPFLWLLFLTVFFNRFRLAPHDYVVKTQVVAQARSVPIDDGTIPSHFSR
jgi:uncharacterized RDD family membrane protein YckC